MAVILTDLSSLNSSVGPDPAQGSLLALLMKDETGWAWGWVSLLLLSPGLPQATLEDVLNPRRQRTDPTPGTVAWWQCCQTLQDSRALVCQSCYLLHRADQLWLSWFNTLSRLAEHTVPALTSIFLGFTWFVLCLWCSLKSLFLFFSECVQ